MVISRKRQEIKIIMKARNAVMTLLTAGLMLGSCTSTVKVPEGKYLIRGTLENVADGTVVELLKEDGRTFKTVCKDTVADGRFLFSDSISGEVPQKLMLFSGDKGFSGAWLDVWVQSGKCVKVTGKDRLLPLWSVDSDIAEQKAAAGFMALCRAEREKSMRWKAEEADLFRTEKEQGLDWGKIDSLRALCAPADSLIYLAELDYMKEAPVTAVWLDKYKLYSSFLQWNHEFGHRDLIRSLSARMSDEDRATEAGQEITAYLNLPETVGVGDDMVDGDLYDLDGNIRHLAEFKGKYILLDFWSQGCGPCVKSLPEMEEITTQYKDRMEVVSISQDPKDSWKEFIARKGLKGNQWNELRKGNTGLAAVYRVKGIPHYVLISPDGKVVCMWSGYGKGSLKAKMEELVK